MQQPPLNLGAQAELYKARGLSGWFVMMCHFDDGTPDLSGSAVAHSPSCYVLQQDREHASTFGAVPVEEIPADVKPCGHCGGGTLPRWRAGQ